MSIANEEHILSRFPASSRFFNSSELPEMKDFQLYRNNKQVSFNSQSNNINYNPFNLPQSKTKTNFPMDFFHLPNKITLTDLPKEQEIPTFHVEDLEANDPPKLIERYKRDGECHGAIKLVLPESTNNLFKRQFQLNGDLYWFQTNKILNNPHEDELTSRLKFHHELIKFHLSRNESTDSFDFSTNSPSKNTSDNVFSDVKEMALNVPENSEKSETVKTGLNEQSFGSNDYRVPTNSASPTLTNNVPSVDEQSHPYPSITIKSENEIKTNQVNSFPSEEQEPNNTSAENSQFKVNEEPSFSSSAASASGPNLPIPSETTNIPENKFEESQRDKLIHEPNGSKKKGQNPDQSTESKNKIPSFLNKFPMIDKRPLDLYKLFRTVVVRGGFKEVVSKKLWAQIGRELGYKGKIMTSLSSSLKSSYLRILYPFEIHLGEKKFEILGMSSINDPDNKNLIDPSVSEKSPVLTSLSPSSDKNENGKRSLNNDDFTSSKRQKIEETPLIIGSAKEFKRSIKIRSSKGLLLNSPHLIDIKPPNTFIVKQDEDLKKRNKRSAEIISSPILPQSQLNHFMKSLILNQHIFDDDFRVKSNGKFASIYSLRQFMEKDLKFQEFIIQQNKQHFNKLSTNTPAGFFQYNEPSMPIIERNIIKLQNFEQMYWKFVENETTNQILNDGLELENGANISTFVNGSGFPKIGDDFLNFKTNLNNLNGNVANNKNAPLPSGPSSTPSVESSFYNTPEYISSVFKASLNPWNAHVLPFLPNSLLGALSESDVNNQSLINSRINIGMTFSTENWRCEDHFTQLYNYQFFGAYKRWYFIPESEFEKFEKLVEEVNEKNKYRVNINNPRWNIEKLAKYLSDEELDYDILINSLENMISSQPDIRLHHSNPLFETLIRKAEKDFKYNQEFLITPDLLISRGIRFTTTIQRPGEVIIKYPKTYSATISFGLNLSEEVNFCTKLWLNYGLEGEKWLKSQSIPSNFSFFKLIVNFIQLYDSGKNIGFNDDIYAEITTIYNSLYLSEISLRNKVRAVIELKEVVVDEKYNVDIDTVSDDELTDTFPSKVVLSDPNTKQSFVLSLASFLRNYKEKSIPFDDLKVELHLMYSDEKLKSLFKILNNYSIDYDSWMKSYENMMTEDSEISLKQYKSLLLEGEKIYSAVSSSNFLNKLTGNDDHETVKLNTFKSYIENLRMFIDDSNAFIDDCQSLLSIKHQQRIRNGNDYQRSHGLAKLIRLYEKIPTLNFICSEVDQILELKNEIENFDRACKTLISKKNKSIQEFDDLVDLGESFGISLPSLSFLVRIRDRMKWIKTFNIIEKGGDPYSDKKDVFLLKDLKDFYDDGLKLLGKNDLDQIKKVEQILNKSLIFNDEVSDFLGFSYVDEIDLLLFEKYVDAIKTTSVFIAKENYEKILVISINLELIKSFIEFKSGGEKYVYQDIRQLLGSLNESGLNYDSKILMKELLTADNWVDAIWEQTKESKIITTINNLTDKSTFNPRLTLNSQLVDKLERLKQKITFSFSENDAYELTSSYIFRSQNESDVTQKYYCFCREFEHGSMIECDKCNEWYHFHCVSNKSTLKELENDDEHYICPVCKLVSSGSQGDDNIQQQCSYEKLKEKLVLGTQLKVVPTNEFNALKALAEAMDHAISNFNQQFVEILQSEDPSKKCDLLRYHLRKFYGAGVVAKDIISLIANEIRKIEGIQNPVLPATTVAGDNSQQLEQPEPPISGAATTSISPSTAQSQTVDDDIDPMVQPVNSTPLISTEDGVENKPPVITAEIEVEKNILQLGNLMKTDVVSIDSTPHQHPVNGQHFSPDEK